MLEVWLWNAMTQGEPEPRAMTLATAAGDGPSARTVSLKEISDGGLVFTTTLYSRKVRELRADRAWRSCCGGPCFAGRCG